jgi:transposase-like protein
MSLLSRSAVARFYGVCPQTIKNWVRDGKIPEPSRSPSGRAVWHADQINPATVAADITNVTLESLNDQ